MLQPALHALNVVVLVYFALLNATYLLTSLLAFWKLRQHTMRIRSLGAEELISSAGAPPITVIAPTYNEEPTCVESVRSLLTLEYPAYEILVVNDGSDDGTLARMLEAFEMEPASRAPTADLPSAEIRCIYRSRNHPGLWLVDKQNGGKADALNAGLSLCRTPFFCAIDADCLLERDALSRIVRPFLEDDRIIASGGVIRVANGCEIGSGIVRKVGLPSNLLAGFQVVEYLRAFLSGRVGWAALGSTLIISGAFGLFRRSIVVDAGGFWTETVGEDMELVVRLHHYCQQKGIPHRITFVPDPVAWTEVPETLGALARQRDRWQRGLVETLTRHIGMLGNPRHGRVGLLGFPFFFFFEMLGPVIEVAGYTGFALTLALGLASPVYVIAFLSLALVLGMNLSLAAVAQEELTFRRYARLRDVFRLFGLALIENFGYRQLTTLWRVRGLVQALRGVHDWGEQKRKGFANTPARASGSD